MALQKYRVVLLVGLATLFMSCKENTDIPQASYSFDVPDHFPEMVYPEDNLPSIGKVNLGKTLFEDKRLSLDGTVSCASCHFSNTAFSDTSALSTGIYNQHPSRNSPPLFNLGYHDVFFRDGGALTLEMQVVAPIENVLEMGHTVADVCEELKTDSYYSEMAEKEFRSEFNSFVLSRSLATYMRSLISGSSKYDAYIEDKGDMTSEELNGLSLFEGKANCKSCHSGFNFTNLAFVNIGLYTSYADSGRQRVTLDINDQGKFKVSSLRNLSFSAPYMHDGSVATLDEVIEHYNQGGQGHWNQSDLIVPLGLTASEKEDLKAFLNTLNDYTFVNR